MNRRQIVLYATFVLLLGVAIGRLPQTLARWSDDASWTGALDDARRLIRDKYVEPVDEQTLARGAIDGMVRSLGDPYSEFVPPAEEASFVQALTGKYAGIGARIDSAAGTLEGVVISTPMEGSPALAAGLRAGDRIIEVDGVSTLGQPLDFTIARLKGEPGTTTSVRVRRPIYDAKALAAITLPGGVLDPRTLPTPALGEAFSISITRAALSDRSVKGLYFDGAAGQWAFDIGQGAERIAYIRIEQFTDRTAEELKGALLAAGVIAPSGDPRLPRGLIIDVRDNPGGLLDQAITMADMFLTEGVIVSTRRRAGTSASGKAAAAAPADSATADTEAIVPASVPVIVLINENSASASEVFAGALKDNGRAIVVGQRSFGKGLVQTIEPLPTLPGAALKLTEQRFYLPGGEMIHRMQNSTRWGVDPTPGFDVQQPEALGELARAVRSALEVVRPTSVAAETAPGAGAGEAKLRTLLATLTSPEAWSTPRRISTHIGDAQLASCVEAITKRIQDGAAMRWVPLHEPRAVEAPVASGTDRERRVLERTQSELRAQLERVASRLAQLEGKEAPASGEPKPAEPVP